MYNITAARRVRTKFLVSATRMIMRIPFGTLWISLELRVEFEGRGEERGVKGASVDSGEGEVHELILGI